MLNIGFPELFLLCLLGVLFLKPDEFRSMIRQLGKWSAEMRKMSREFTSELAREADFDEIRDSARKIEDQLLKSGIDTEGELFGADDDAEMGDELEDGGIGGAGPDAEMSLAMGDEIEDEMAPPKPDGDAPGPERSIPRESDSRSGSSAPVDDEPNGDEPSGDAPGDDGTDDDESGGRAPDGDAPGADASPHSSSGAGNPFLGSG